MCERLAPLWEHLPDEERCPTCGQPDNCGECNHVPLAPEQVRLLVEG